MNVSTKAFVLSLLFGLGMLVVTAVLLLHPALTGGLINALTGTFALAAVLLLSALAALIVYLMAVGTIDLKFLIADEQGAASLARFQMLLFTFVIVALYFLYSLYTLFMAKSGTPFAMCPANSDKLLTALNELAMQIKAGDAAKLAAASDGAQSAAKVVAMACSNTLNLPEIPGSVLGLLGISGGSYLLSKGISAAADKPASNPNPAPNPNPNPAPNPNPGPKVG